VELVRTANRSIRPDRGVVPEPAQRLLDEFAAYGSAADVRAQLSTWDSAVDVTMVGLPAGLPWSSIEATVRAAAPG
jgi:hypothetical protein